MSWLNPAGAWWLLLVPALLILYLLRSRQVRRRVATLRFWHDLPQMDRPRIRLRHPPRSLVLLLELLLLAAGALALIRPALTSAAGRQQVVLLDASGSMSAQDGGSSRFDQARAAVRQLAGDMTASDTLTLLRVGAGVTTACLACAPANVGRALDALQAGAGQADWTAAFEVAADLVRGYGAAQVTTVVVSDGAFAPQAVDSYPGAIHFVAVGHPLDNHGIVVATARRPPDGRPGYTAYTSIANRAAVTSTVTVNALADTVPLPSRQLTIPPGGQADLVWALPVGTARLTLQLVPPDALPADDQAVLFLPVADQQHILVHSTAPDLYTRALAGIPGLTAITGTTPISTDLTLIEGAVPDPLPAGGLLLVNPSSPLLPATGVFSDVQPLPATTNQPILAGLDLGALLVQRAQAITPPDWLDPLVNSTDGPLLLVGEQDGRRIAVLTFDPRDSNLPKLDAFPVLMANLVDWLDPLTGAGALAPGTAVPLPPGATVVTPGGRHLTVSAGGLFAATEEAGVYAVQAAGRPALTFAVNMADAQESDLAPQPHPELDRAAPAGSAVHVQEQELWQPLAGLVFVLLSAEWLFFCWRRGQT